MPPRDREKRWSQNYDACIRCGTTSKRHVSKGLCAACRHQVTKEEAWPIGLGVYVAHDGAWRHGLIEARPNRALATVRLDGGEIVQVGFKAGHISVNDPGSAPVPRSKRRTPQTGIIDGLFARDENGRIAARRGDVWSTKAPQCLGCGRTDRPHEAFGRCRTCYLRHKRSSDPKWRENVNRRQKARSLTSDYQERYDDKRRTDPKRMAQHRESSRRYHQRHLAKWPDGSRVSTPLGNVDLNGRAPTLSKKVATKGPFLTGTIERTNNASAYVRFAHFAMWIPFARLTKTEVPS